VQYCAAKQKERGILWGGKTENRNERGAVEMVALKFSS